MDKAIEIERQLKHCMELTGTAASRLKTGSTTTSNQQGGRQPNFDFIDGEQDLTEMLLTRAELELDTAMAAMPGEEEDGGVPRAVGGGPRTTGDADGADHATRGGL